MCMEVEGLGLPGVKVLGVKVLGNTACVRGARTGGSLEGSRWLPQLVRQVPCVHTFVLITVAIQFV